MLRALLDQVRGRGLLENAAVLPQWADLLAENVRTTLPLRDLGALAGLASLARDLSPDRVLQLSINPADVALDAEDGTDLYWNSAALAELVARWEQGPTPAPAAAATPPPAQLPGAAPTVTPAPASAAPDENATVQVLNGAAVDGIAGGVTAYLSARGFAMGDPATVTPPYEHTTIIDYSGRPATRAALARTLGVAARYVLAEPGPDAPPPDAGVDIVVVVGADYKAEWAGE